MLVILGIFIIFNEKVLWKINSRLIKQDFILP